MNRPTRFLVLLLTLTALPACGELPPEDYEDPTGLAEDCDEAPLEPSLEGLVLIPLDGYITIVHIDDLDFETVIPAADPEGPLQAHYVPAPEGEYLIEFRTQGAAFFVEAEARTEALAPVFLAIPE